jgi:hypothetical protein
MGYLPGSLHTCCASPASAGRSRAWLLGVVDLSLRAYGFGGVVTPLTSARAGGRSERDWGDAGERSIVGAAGEVGSRWR